MCWVYSLFFFFFNDTATTEIYTLSLHDALPISGHRLVPGRVRCPAVGGGRDPFGRGQRGARRRVDLLVVVQLDDLHRGEVGRRQLGEVLQQHRPDGEVGRHQAVRTTEGDPEGVEVRSEE